MWLRIGSSGGPFERSSETPGCATKGWNLIQNLSSVSSPHCKQRCDRLGDDIV